jgi:chemotaxis response regulator CheB
MKKLRIFLIDESPFFRRWFRKLILSVPGSRILGEAEDPLIALRSICSLKPDAIIMDVKTQWKCGVALIRNIRKLTPVPKVIVLTSEGYGRYQRKISEKADFLVDKITEYNKIPEILKRVASDSVSEAS